MLLLIQISAKFSIPAVGDTVNMGGGLRQSYLKLHICLTKPAKYRISKPSILRYSLRRCVN
jgi:hypothetical protein